MKILKNILAIIVGYAVFVISAVLLFKLSGIDPHADPSIGIMALTIVYGIVFAFAGGFLTQLISGCSTLKVTYILAAIMAGFAAFSMFKSGGNHYSQLAAIFLFAPAAVLGGAVYLNNVRKRK